MTNILITGATGQLGGAIARHLAKRIPVSRIAALARDPAKAGDLTALSIDVRKGDYADAESLIAAFSGIDTLVFISTVAFSDAITQHRNVVASAKAAGIRHVYYTGIQRHDGSGFAISQVTDWERETERLVAESGMSVTLLRNAMYLDALPFMLGDVLLKGRIEAPAGQARAALAVRDELAEAIAILVADAGHEGRTYTLGGSEAVSMAEIAEILSASSGRRIDYDDIAVADYVAARSAQGLPDFVAAFLAEWFVAIGAGEFAEVTGDLEAILGRKPLTAAHFLLAQFAGTMAG